MQEYVGSNVLKFIILLFMDWGGNIDSSKYVVKKSKYDRNL